MGDAIPAGDSATARRLTPERGRRRLTGILRRRIAIFVVLVVTVGYVAPSVVVASVLTEGTHTPLAVAASAIGSHWDDVAFPSGASDHITLRGWLFHAASPTGRSAILVHGWQDNRTTAPIPDVARHLLAEGYDVLLFDLRSCGLSDGDRFTLGLKEAGDVVGAHDFMLSRRYAPNRMLVLGWSMGAASVIEAIPRLEDVAALAEDSGYAELQPVLDAQLPPQSHLPALFNPGIELAAQLLFGVNPNLRPVDVVRAHPERALLIIHGTQDDFVPPANAVELDHASTNPRTHIVWFTASHAHAEESAPTKYFRSLDGFADEEISADGGR